MVGMKPPCPPGLVLGFVLAGCSGSTVTGAGPDAGPSVISGDDASSDAAGEGSEGDGSRGNDAMQGADAIEASLGGRDAATEAGAGGVQCGTQGPPSFPAFDKTCSTDADCVLAVHMLSCCGDVLVTAISRGALPAFQADESTCESQYPGCGCASNSVKFENGVAYGGTGNPTSAAAASCVAHSCLANFTGPTFPCGGQVCAAGVDYCEVQATADGASPANECVFTGFTVGDAGVGCSSIAVATGCTCAQGQGNVTVTCH
jgi:hypothetical protein